MLHAFTGALFSLWLAAAAFPATASAAGCAWGQLSDLDAVQATLRNWAVSIHLPSYDEHAWDLSIAHGSAARLTLPFAKGTLTVGWDLDHDCRPVAVTVEASLDYDGVRPDDAAVVRLVKSLAPIAGPQTSEHGDIDAPPPVTLATALSVAFLVAVGVIIARFPSPASSRSASLLPLKGIAPITAIQLVGLVAIGALLPYRFIFETPPFSGRPAYACAVLLVGILPLVTFLWLVLAGYFGYGSSSRHDWPALLTFLLALAIREGYARHAIEEIEIHFFYGWFPNRHSVVYPLFELFVQPLARDPYRLMMHVNGVLGALAALPLYLFVRQRTKSRMAAAMVATFFAVHPIIVQMAPTDSHYSLVLFTWFAGLALLSADVIGAKELVGGGVLLGIAATSRAEGTLYLVASLYLLDVPALLAAARRHRAVAVLSATAVVGLIAVHVSMCFGGHVPPGQGLPNIGNLRWREVLRAGVYSFDFNDPIIVALVGVGALAGLVNRHLQIGTGAAIAALIVVWPVSMTTTGGFTILHRLVPVCALHVIGAGIGAAWLLSWVPAALRRPWLASMPVVAVALYFFATYRHDIRDPNAVTDEFWMLRDHLAPGGVMDPSCTLLAVGRAMDTDIHNFAQVLPGITTAHCEQEDCVRRAGDGGCVYYLRSLNCYFAEEGIAPECVPRGRTASGDVRPCLDPQCDELERQLELVPIEERTSDAYAVFHGLPDRPQWPRVADIALYRVTGAKR